MLLQHVCSVAPVQAMLQGPHTFSYMHGSDIMNNMESYSSILKGALCTDMRWLGAASYSVTLSSHMGFCTTPQMHRMHHSLNTRPQRHQASQHECWNHARYNARYLAPVQQCTCTTTMSLVPTSLLHTRLQVSNVVYDGVIWRAQGTPQVNVDVA